MKPRLLAAFACPTGVLIELEQWVKAHWCVFVTYEEGSRAEYVSAVTERDAWRAFLLASARLCFYPPPPNETFGEQLFFVISEDSSLPGDEPGA